MWMDIVIMIGTSEVKPVCHILDIMADDIQDKIRMIFTLQIKFSVSLGAFGHFQLGHATKVRKRRFRRSG
jgi:hypothetical protein